MILKHFVAKTFSSVLYLSVSKDVFVYVYLNVQYAHMWEVFLCPARDISHLVSFVVSTFGKLEAFDGDLTPACPSDVTRHFLFLPLVFAAACRSGRL